VVQPVILAAQEAESRGITVRSQLSQIFCETLSLKYPTPKRAGRVAQVLECLLSKHKALSSNFSFTKKKKILIIIKIGIFSVRFFNTE
jgi:hypothetical protein